MKGRWAGFQISLWMVVLCTAIFGFLNFGVAEEAVPRKLTLMVYICGSNLESQNGLASDDIKEMITSGVDDREVNILVMTGGSSDWRIHWGTGNNTILEIGNQKLRAVWPSNREERDIALNMGDASTLAFFLQYGATNYPAEDYALILWDHGGGPMNGVCFDELFSKNNTKDSLDLSELRTALSDSPFDSGNPLEWIGFDACLMSSAETAFICAPFAKYMIASQETEPGTGWDYSFLKRASEGLRGDEMGKLIIESYMDDSHASELILTLSCIDLSQMGNVEAATDSLFNNIITILTSECYSEISNSRRNAKSYGRASTASEYDLVDLFSLAEQFSSLATDSVNDLETALENAIVYNDGNQENSHGLSLYYPYYNKVDYQKNWGEQYSKWGFSDGYKDFITHYANIWLGEQLADWTNLRAIALPPLHDSQEFTLQLTHQQEDNYAFAQLLILGRMGSSEPYYYKVEEIDDIQMDKDRILHADYDYKALYVVDDKGKPRCGPIPYEIVDGYYLIRANLSDITLDTYLDDIYSVRNEKKEISMHAKKVYLQCVPNSVGDGLDVIGVIDLLEDLGDGINGLLVEGEGLYMGKQTIKPNLETWNWVWFFNFPREYQTDEDGNILPYQNWNNPNIEGKGSPSMWEINKHVNWELKFLKNQYYDEDLYAQYIVHDTQGNLQGSNLVPINNPNRIHVAALDYTLYENDNFEIKAKGIDLGKSEFEDSIIIQLGLTDRRKEYGDIQITAQNIMLDRCYLNKSYIIVGAPMKEGEIDYILRIPTEDIPTSLRNMISKIRFDISIKDQSSGNPIDEFEVTIVQDIDISIIRPDSHEEKVIAELLAGDIKYELIGDGRN